MRTYFILSLIPYFIYIVCKSKKAMHMLQQNWYNDGNRYFKWILDNVDKVFITFDVMFVFFALFKLISFNASVIIFAIFYSVVTIINNKLLKKEQNKKMQKEIINEIFENKNIIKKKKTVESEIKEKIEKKK